MAVEDLKNKVMGGGEISREEALLLAEADLEELCLAADEIRRFYFKEDFDLCAVISARGGRCSEDCRYCAQSACAKTEIEKTPLVSGETLEKDAKLREKQGIRHYGLVSSGRRLSDRETDCLCPEIREIVRETKLSLCASLGLLKKEQLLKLKAAGVRRIHNNLETSRRYFPCLCTTHTYDDKIAVIRAAREAGLEVCSGGIFGVGETMEDRIDLALTLRSLDVQSVPVNMLKSVEGTPLGNLPVLEASEVRRVIALFRFLLPGQYIRLAAGRDLLDDAGFSCFRSGANAAITGDMLTVKGVSVENDVSGIEKIGYRIRS